MNRIYQTILAAALLLTAAPGAAHAAATDPPGAFTFETVDSVQLITYQGRLAVKGIGVGGTAAVEYRFYFQNQVGAADCQKQAMLAMERPGRYFLNFEYDQYSYGYNCRLTRR